ncbi:uncharacterized protein LOC112568954 [Pomacea canaliculata]|uniref:uncharacterized protein LOC112568954 n=1 Tax=Pomacea canaliculata TaxID=400727 RepID=UPI000D72DC79|nr:uncharacterized protein LOC112568954 [Pomacea canaliculata]
MKLEVTVVLMALLCVSQTNAQMESIMSLLGMDPVPMPPPLPKSLDPAYQRQQQQMHMYQFQQQQRQLIEQRRKEQQFALLQHLRNMSSKQLQDLQQKLAPEQLQRLVGLLKTLKQEQSGFPLDKALQASRQENAILSGANRIRQLAALNSAQGKKAFQSVASRRTTPSRGSPNMFSTMSKISSQPKKAMDALAAGCSYPMGMDGMEATLMFAGSCSNPMARGTCMANGRSCVNVGMSIMCCPAGYSSRTLDAFKYMKQMQDFMTQIS